MAASLLAACEAKPTNELLKLQVANAEVNTDGFCLDCATYERVIATLKYDTDPAIFDVVYVDMVQYKVDFAFDLGASPSIARETAVQVAIGGKQTMGVVIADPAVRAWVTVRYGNAKTTAEATLTAFGFDHRNELVEIKKKFDVTFSVPPQP